MARTALLIGGSGLVGAFCLQALLQEPAYRSVVSLGRRELPINHPKLIQKIQSFEQLAALQLPTIDEVFCALGTTIRKAGSQAAFRRVDYEYPLMVADHALKFGAKQFMLVSSVGADPKSKNFYLRTKANWNRHCAVCLSKHFIFSGQASCWGQEKNRVLASQWPYRWPKYFSSC